MLRTFRARITPLVFILVLATSLSGLAVRADVATGTPACPAASYRCAADLVPGARQTCSYDDASVSQVLEGARPGVAARITLTSARQGVPAERRVCESLYDPLQLLRVAHFGMATNTPRPFASSIVDDVMAETRAGSGNLTSRYTLTADEALSTGEQWVGPGYSEIGKPGSGVFRSADGTRQFRIDNGSITGAHNPGVPHVHLETISPGSKVPLANNHIPFKN